MKALKSSLIYFSGTILEKGLAFLLIPLYTHYLSTTEYGILNMIQSVIAIFTIVFSLSLSGAASRFHFDGRERYRQIHYGNLFSYLTLFSVVGTLFLWLFKSEIFSLIGNIPVYPYIYFVIIISYGSAIFSLYQLMLQMEHQAVEYTKNNLAKFILTTLLSIYFVIYTIKKVDGILLATSMVLIYFLFYIFYSIQKKKIKLNFNKKLIKKNLSYTIYLVPHNLAGVLNNVLDRFYISYMINLSNVGVYALAGQLSSVLGLFSTAINRALTPSILKAYKYKNYRYLKELANIVIIFITILALVLSLFSYDILAFIVPQSYNDANLVISLLSFYAVVQMYYYMTCGVLFYDKRATKYVAMATMLALALNFVLNYFFIQLWGLQGAAGATLISIIIVNYIVIFIADRYIKVGFEHLKIHFFIVIGFLIAHLCYNVLWTIKISIVFIVLSVFLFMERRSLLIRSLRGYIYEKINH